MHEDGDLTATGSCSWVNQDGGIGECSVVLSAEWFTYTASATVTVTASYAGVDFATSNAGTVVLEEVHPAHPALTDVGMVASFVSAPFFAGDTFTVEVLAHTGNNPTYRLKAWTFALTYDTSLIEFVGVSYTSLYKIVETAGASQETAGANVIVANAGLKPDTDFSAVTDQTDLYLATFTFKVPDGVAAGTYDDALSLQVNSMINQFTISLLPGAMAQPAQINDLRGGVQTSGQLQVEAPVVMGLLAYPDAGVGELANTAVLNGVDVRSAISVVQLTTRPSQPFSTAPTSAYACSAPAFRKEL